MKAFTYFVIASLSISLFISNLSEGLAEQSQTAAIIAVVEGQYVLRESLANKSIQKQIETRRNQYQEEISAKDTLPSSSSQSMG